MSVQIRTADNVVSIEHLRSVLLGPTIARLLRDDAQKGERNLPHYSLVIGGIWGLDATSCWCPLCGMGWAPERTTFAYVVSETSALFKVDPRVGKALLTLHKDCVARAQDTGLTFDEWMASMQADAAALVALIAERGDA